MYFRDLEYEMYDDYLSGKEWREIKAFFYKHCKEYKCGICGSRETIVLHKRSYRYLSLSQIKRKYGNRQDKALRYFHTYLTYLCSSCHKKVHFESDGSRVPLEYRKLKDRELKLKKHTKKLPPKIIVRHETRKSFLGSYFQSLLKKKV